MAGALATALLFACGSHSTGAADVGSAAPVSTQVARAIPGPGVSSDGARPPISAEAARAVLGHEVSADAIAQAGAWKAQLRAETHDSHTRLAAGAINAHQERAELIAQWNEYMDHLESTFGCSHDQALAMISQETRLRRGSDSARLTAQPHTTLVAR